MLSGWVADGMDPHQISVVDPHPAAVPDGVRVLNAVPLGEAPPALVLLAIKPQILAQAAPEIAPALGPETILLSILAGVDVAALKTHFPVTGRIIRAMPNMPASIGKGVTVLCGETPDDAISRLMRPLGTVEWIADEALFHAVIAVSGSGPAFVFRYLDAITQAGVDLGLPAEMSQRLAMATVEGSAALAAASSDSLYDLAEKVRSPGGTTNAGLNALDASDFAEILARVLRATADRSEEMTLASR